MFGSKSSSTPTDNANGTPDEDLEDRQKRRQAETSRIERNRDAGPGYEGGLGGTGTPPEGGVPSGDVGTDSLG